MQPVSQLLLAACGVLTASAAELVCVCVLVRCLPLRLGPITVVVLLFWASVDVALVRGGHGVVICLSASGSSETWQYRTVRLTLR
jgi:hypothetical protein